jgi:hypothetical protein
MFADVTFVRLVLARRCSHDGVRVVNFSSLAPRVSGAARAHVNAPDTRAPPGNRNHGRYTYFAET